MLSTKEVKLDLGKYEQGLALEVATSIKKSEHNVERTIGLDMGSTNNRLVPYNIEAEDENEIFGEVVEVSSDLGIVGDISHIKSVSSKIYDNLEFIIKDVTVPDKKENKMFSEEHFVKYGLYQSVANQTLARPSNISKVDLEATYINALATMAIDIYLTIQATGIVRPCYHIIPAITLPPEDFKSAIFTNRFKARMAGHYSVEMPRLGVSFNILIDEDNIFVDKEPNAVVYQLATEYDTITEVTTVALDGGGKSIDVSLVVDGVLVEKGSATIPYGGNLLVEDIKDEYVRTTAKSAPNDLAIKRALSSGILVRGKNIEDITEIIKAAKETMARRIFNDLIKIFDRANLSIDDIGFFAFHGRLFEDTLREEADGDTIKTITAGRVSDGIQDMLAKVNDNIETCVVTDTATIATGVAVSRMVDES